MFAALIPHAMSVHQTQHEVLVQQILVSNLNCMIAQQALCRHTCELLHSSFCAAGSSALNYCALQCSQRLQPNVLGEQTTPSNLLAAAAVIRSAR